MQRRSGAQILLAIVFTGLALGLAACEHEGPAERAGKKVDHAVEKGADAAENAGDKVKDAVD